MEPDPDEEDMEYVKLDNERKHHWRMIFEEYGGGVENHKAIPYIIRGGMYT